MHRLLAGIALLASVALPGCGKSAASDPNAKAAAEFVLSRGGVVTLVGSDITLKKGSMIPEGTIAIKSIDLNQKGITDADLQKLAGLTNLESLGLHSSKITLQGLDQVVALATLQELEFSYTPLNDEGLQKLTQLPRLQRLFVYGTRITKDGLDKFRQAKPKVTLMR